MSIKLCGVVVGRSSFSQQIHGPADFIIRIRFDDPLSKGKKTAFRSCFSVAKELGVSETSVVYPHEDAGRNPQTRWHLDSRFHRGASPGREPGISQNSGASVCRFKGLGSGRTYDLAGVSGESVKEIPAAVCDRRATKASAKSGATRRAFLNLQTCSNTPRS